MDAQLKAQLQQTVLVSNSTAVNADGELVYTASSSHLARVVGKNTYVRNMKGEQVVSDKQIIFTSTVDVQINSRIYLPGETTSASGGWVPIAVATRVDENGSSDYTKIWLGERGR